VSCLMRYPIGRILRPVARFWLCSGILLLVPGTFCHAQSSPDVRELRVISDDNYPPYLFRNSDGDLEGYLVDYWELWEKETGVSVQLEATNWDDAQRILQLGGADVIDMMFRTPAREPLYDFSRPYADLPVNIYTHASISGISGLSTLKGFQIGVQAGDACIDQLRDSGIDSLVVHANYAELIEAAIQQELKLFCMDEAPANFYLYRLGAQSEFNKAFELYVGEFHRAVSKGNQATLQLVEQGMRAIPPEELDALRREWFGSSLLMPCCGCWAKGCCWLRTMNSTRKWPCSF